MWPWLSCRPSPWCSVGTRLDPPSVVSRSRGRLRGSAPRPGPPEPCGRKPVWEGVERAGGGGFSGRFHLCRVQGWPHGGRTRGQAVPSPLSGPRGAGKARCPVTEVQACGAGVHLLLSGRLVGAMRVSRLYLLWVNGGGWQRGETLSRRQAQAGSAPSLHLAVGITAGLGQAVLPCPCVLGQRDLAPQRPCHLPPRTGGRGMSV